MKPAELGFKLEQFKKEIAPLNGDDLLDRWIKLKDSEESKEPDLGFLKIATLEAVLVQQYGIGKYHLAVEARRKTKPDA